MKLTIQAVNFEIAEKLQKHIEKKAHKFEKLLAENAELEFRLTVIKRETALNKETHLRVLGIGQELFAEKVYDTFEQGVDETIDAITRQIEKYKEKLQGK